MQGAKGSYIPECEAWSAWKSSSLECGLCGPGSYSPAAGLLECISCGSGAYSNSSGALACFSCLAGQQQPLSGQTECKPCPAGWYKLEQGTALCLPCLAGKVSKSSARECSACPLGTFTDVEGQRSVHSSPKLHEHDREFSIERE